jgi:hypothetical protein
LNDKKLKEEYDRAKKSTDTGLKLVFVFLYPFRLRDKAKSLIRGLNINENSGFKECTWAEIAEISEGIGIGNTTKTGEFLRDFNDHIRREIEMELKADIIGEFLNRISDWEQLATLEVQAYKEVDRFVTGIMKDLSSDNEKVFLTEPRFSYPRRQRQFVWANFGDVRLKKSPEYSLGVFVAINREDCRLYIAVRGTVPLKIDPRLETTIRDIFKDFSDDPGFWQEEKAGVKHNKFEGWRVLNLNNWESDRRITQETMNRLLTAINRYAEDNRV